jgi:hypothetical protein
MLNRVKAIELVLGRGGWIAERSPIFGAVIGPVEITSINQLAP